MQKLNLEISSLRSFLLNREITLPEMVRLIYDRIDHFQDHNVWIWLLPRTQAIEKAEMLERLPEREKLPLFGIPYAVKDNIDVAGVPTTAACKEFTYVPDVSAEAVMKLEAAGAFFIGKTNMDQFATGLVGTRSPYGIVKNSVDPEYISGGSSSGSAVAVALGMVSFALGTDTAGSGRVPAGFNNIYGLKPTKKLISTEGVVPACKSLDCVSVFTLSLDDAGLMLQLLKDSKLTLPVPDPGPASSFTFAIPDKGHLEFFGNKDYEELYNRAITQFRTAGGRPVEIDFTPFLETAELLYEGPWLAERMASIKNFYELNAGSLLQETKKIIEGGSNFSAVDTFLSLYKLDDLKKRVDSLLEVADFLLVPTTPTIYRIKDILKEPYSLNRNLGYYTNFVNLLDLCALAVPNGFQSDGLPVGITLIGKAHTDLHLLEQARILSI